MNADSQCEPTAMRVWRVLSAQSAHGTRQNPYFLMPGDESRALHDFAAGCRTVDSYQHDSTVRNR